MRKQYFGDRKRYNRAYQALRKGWNIYPEQNPMGIPEEIWDCAILTFDYFDSEFDGWVNRCRRAKFKNLSAFIKNWKGEIPF